MNDSMTEVVELRLANTGTELWPAIEAAQFARFMVHSKPISSMDRLVITAFVEAFAKIVEIWEETPASNRAFRLNSLTADVRLLNESGYFVHCACIERTLTKPDGNGLTVPIAVISIDQSCEKISNVALPAELDINE